MSRGTESSNNMSCYSPKQGVPCTVVGPYNITIKCDLPSNRELFSNYVDYHRGCMIVEDKRLYPSIKPLCFAKEVPITLYYLSSSPPLDCLCVSPRCLYRAYWTRKLIAISVIPPTPTTTPLPPPDLKCKVCTGIARCHRLPNMDLNCTIPEEANCTEVVVDSTRIQCTIKLEVSLISFTEENIPFKAGTEAISQKSSNAFEVRRNNSERLTFIRRCQSNVNGACNINLTIASVYLNSTSDTTDLLCYNCTSNEFNCRPDRELFCQIPLNNCDIVKAPPNGSCSLAIPVHNNRTVLFAATAFPTSAVSQVCTSPLLPLINGSSFHMCFCSTNLCNGNMTIVSS